ncbi:MAG: LysE family translocator [Rhodospirillales bacterium]|nr:LysE family translocator [Alphaproteobacteria bacterium]MCB1840617.1 LysE family translocator [Alphaproteobacteria bacterium]MCB9977217.1 LysE family translocator [Rhodospirillales bacterium]
MEFILKWLLMASVQAAATISPGPAFVLAVRNAVTYDRRAGLFTALGLGAGVAVHVMVVLGGLAVLLQHYTYVFDVIRYAGAAYLIFIGSKALISRRQAKAEEPEVLPEGVLSSRAVVSGRKAFSMGFLTNLLNPKAVIFFTAVFTQFIGPGTPVSVMALYGLTSVVIEITWFSGVAVVLTNPGIKERFMGAVHWVERTCGGLMIGLGLKLAFSR